MGKIFIKCSQRNTMTEQYCSNCSVGLDLDLVSEECNLYPLKTLLLTTGFLKGLSDGHCSGIVVGWRENVLSPRQILGGQCVY